MSNRRKPFGSAGDRALPKGDVFEVLRNRRRRYVLHYLDRFGGPVSLGELATRIAAWEYETPVERVTDDQRKRVYTTLQQRHLRRMADAGVIEYDDDEQVVSGTPATGDLTVYLEIVPGSGFPWREYYLAIGSISTAAVVARWVAVFPLTLLSPLQWAAVISVTLTLSAAYQTYHGADVRLHGTGTDTEAESPPEPPGR